MNWVFNIYEGFCWIYKDEKDKILVYNFFIIWEWGYSFKLIVDGKRD